MVVEKVCFDVINVDDFDLVDLVVGKVVCGESDKKVDVV